MCACCVTCSGLAAGRGDAAGPSGLSSATWGHLLLKVSVAEPLEQAPFPPDKDIRPA